MKSLIDLLQHDLNDVINKYKDQGISVGETIGAIEIVKMELYLEQRGINDIAE